MICLLLIMTMVFISTESAEQKIRHSDTLLKEEEMNAKTKAWLLMVESGKVDQDELRRITPKSIFIAPLLASSTVKCKEGYRHDHLGQCVKVIKLDPKLQLELLLQRLNKLYTEKKEEEEKEEKEEEREEEEEEEDNKEKEIFHVSNGPLQFSIPISDEKSVASQNETEVGQDNQDNNSMVNITAAKDKTVQEFMPIPLPFIYLNQTNQTNQTDHINQINQSNQTTQTKEIESSGAEPLNDTEQFEISQFEGSGAVESGDTPFEEETMTESIVNLLPDEPDYLDTNTESVTEIQTTTESPTEPTSELPTELPTTENTTISDKNQSESIQNKTAEQTPNTTEHNATEHNPTVVVPKEVLPVQNKLFIKPKSNLDKIIFPTDESLKTLSSDQSTRIRFPDELPQPKSPSYQYPSDIQYKFGKYQVHPSAIPQEQFWWLPKNWQIDESQKNSALVKVWSRLPLIHDITFPRESSDDFSSFSSENIYQKKPETHFEDESFFISNNHQRSLSRSAENYKNNRFQDIVRTQRRNFRKRN